MTLRGGEVKLHLYDLSRGSGNQATARIAQFDHSGLTLI